jgi:hypothetical protein
MESVPLDAWVLDALMPDLVGHDRRPSAFVVYLLLWRRTGGGARAAHLSHRMIADGTGLSPRAVQQALRVLERRQLVESKRKSATSVPAFKLRCHWRGRATRGLSRDGRFG